MPGYIDDAAKAADDIIRRLGGGKPEGHLLGAHSAIRPAPALSADAAARADALIAKLDGMADLGNPTGTVVRPWGEMARGEALEKYPAFAPLKRATRVQDYPAAGTKIYNVDSARLLGELAYPEDLLAAAAKRLLDSPFQRPATGQTDWLYARMANVTEPETPGRAMQFGSRATPDSYASVYDIGAANKDATKTLMHELRHGTNHYGFTQKRAMPSVTGAYRAAHRAEPLRETFGRDYQNYLAKPTEIFSYVAEAGDDYVRKTGRLIDNPRAADEAVSAWMDNAGTMASEAQKDFYGNAYRSSPAARRLMQEMLMRYYAVPIAAGAAGATTQE